MSVEPIPSDSPRISPILLYDDVAAALDFLSAAFGFEEVPPRFKGEDGKVQHASMKLGDAIIMLGWPGDAYKNPKQVGHPTSIQYVYVEDVDAHCARARNAGAEIASDPEDQFYGDRRYAAVDPEGHHWYFATHVADVDLEAAAGS